MQHWLNASFVPLEQLAPLAIAAEEIGFTGIAMADHLVFPDDSSSVYPYSDDGDILWPQEAPWADPWVAVATMAAVTERLRFTTDIQIAPLREPIALAKAVATAQVLSGGRVACGFGVGWLREEYEAVGVDFRTRGRRMDELLTVLRLLWSGSSVEHHGEFFDFDPLSMRPSADVEIHIGGNSAPALRRAARNDGWVGTHRGVAATLDLLAQLDGARAGAERSDAPFHVRLTGPDLLADDATGLAELEAAGVDAITIPIAALGGSRSIDERIVRLRRLRERLV